MTGYGKATFGDKGDNRYAHRLAYEASKGRIPAGQLIRHACDNPPCVNPDHLLLGDKSSNGIDAIERGLMRVGEARPNSRVTDVDLRQMVKRYRAGETQKALATEYSCSQSYVSMVVSNQRRTHTPR